MKMLKILMATMLFFGSILGMQQPAKPGIQQNLSAILQISDAELVSLSVKELRSLKAQADNCLQAIILQLNLLERLIFRGSEPATLRQTRLSGVLQLTQSIVPMHLCIAKIDAELARRN